MAKLALLFLLLGTVSGAQTTSTLTMAQTVIPTCDVSLSNPPCHIARPYDLTVREIIETLSDFDVYHTSQQPFYQAAYGVTNFDSSPPAIWLFNTGDRSGRLSTVIHELLHVHYRNLHIEASEEFVRSEEDRIYAKLFGEVK